MNRMFAKGAGVVMIVLAVVVVMLSQLPQSSPVGLSNNPESQMADTAGATAGISTPSANPASTGATGQTSTGSSASIPPCPAPPNDTKTGTQSADLECKPSQNQIVQDNAPAKCMLNGVVVTNIYKKSCSTTISSDTVSGYCKGPQSCCATSYQDTSGATHTLANCSSSVVGGIANSGGSQVPGGTGASGTGSGTGAGVNGTGPTGAGGGTSVPGGGTPSGSLGGTGGLNTGGGLNSGFGNGLTSPINIPTDQTPVITETNGVASPPLNPTDTSGLQQVSENQTTVSDAGSAPYASEVPSSGSASPTSEPSSSAGVETYSQSSASVPTFSENPALDYTASLGQSYSPSSAFSSAVSGLGGELAGSFPITQPTFTPSSQASSQNSNDQSSLTTLVSSIGTFAGSPTGLSSALDFFDSILGFTPVSVTLGNEPTAESDIVAGAQVSEDLVNPVGATTTEELGMPEGSPLSIGTADEIGGSSDLQQFLSEEESLAQAQSDYAWLQAQIDAWQAAANAGVCDQTCEEALGYLESELPGQAQAVQKLQGIVDQGPTAVASSTSQQQPTFNAQIPGGTASSVAQNPNSVLQTPVPAEGAPYYVEQNGQWCDQYAQCIPESEFASSPTQNATSSSVNQTALPGFEQSSQAQNAGNPLAEIVQTVKDWIKDILSLFAPNSATTTGQVQPCSLFKSLFGGCGSGW